MIKLMAVVDQGLMVFLMIMLVEVLEQSRMKTQMLILTFLVMRDLQQVLSNSSQLLLKQVNNNKLQHLSQHHQQEEKLYLA
jgi:hypothetical protein